MTDLLVVQEVEILAEEAQDSVLAEQVEEVEILAVAEQGPPGRQGPPGPAGGATTVKVGPLPISGHSVVACDSAGELVAADATNPAHRGAVLGVVADAYSPGDDAVVQTGYVLEHAGWTWAPGPVLVGLSGQLAQAPPAGALFAQVIGQALSSTRVLIDINPPITLA
ncbi:MULTISPECIES: hypothetical protein [Delftia]|uniref:hypothetical protein n=1 Tax=Delftia TaxID=80865 RepID=UPI000F8255CF|nr:MULTISPECIES: hypothetical protein [Delftia]BDD44466.1 hypothetical protein 12 [bacterium]BDD45610.1 hypothetical protein 5 [Pseudomonadota bacterium]WEL96950.1 hypothetical protein PW274_23180 [Delftia tsuruhatensis]WEM01166.1 hypothetical protein PW274_13035 [Delftia tsuruhatensis]WQM84914.1 hypothetical protein RNT40_08685 [Delftia tsuruhatensis]